MRKYSQLKIFHLGSRLSFLFKKEKEIGPPIHIRIKPTNVCNHDCSYCSYRSNALQLGNNMVRKDYIPKEKMSEIIEDIIGIGVKAVTFSGGGEPFCYPYLLDAVKQLANSTVKFAAITNGSKLEGKIAEIFAHSGTWLRVSIDGWDDASYAEYRKVPQGEFSKVLKNMKGFIKYGGKCYLGASIVIDKKNAGHIYELAKKIKNTGAHSVKFSPCIVRDDYEKNNDYHRPIFRQVKEEIAKVLDKIAGEKFEVSDSYHIQLETFKKEYTWCPCIQLNPAIGADSRVYSCHDKAYTRDGLLGSIKKVRVKDFWFSNKKKFFRINPSIDCMHHCVKNDVNKLLIEYLTTDPDHMDFI